MTFVYNSQKQVGITTGNIRPLTNNDPTNNAQQKFGLPRPIQHYRKGITFKNINNNRQVKSYTGGNKLISQMIDIPGGFSIKPNTTETNTSPCNGIEIITDLIDNAQPQPEPEPQTEHQPEHQNQDQDKNYPVCCQERNAIIRVLPTSSNLTQNTNLQNIYYTSLQQYRNNRCQTYDQKAFNFQSTINPKNNTYNSMGQPINSACKVSVYKTNNPQFSQQGAVKSSLRTLKNVTTTINSRVALYNHYFYGYGKPLSLNDDVVKTHITIPFILKNKVTPPISTTCNHP
jgi:hypothetical protein